MDRELITPAIIIYQSDFKKIKLIDLTNNNKNTDSLSYYENQIKSILNYRLSNNKRLISLISGGALFSFNVYHNKHNKTWDINIWDVSGSTTVTYANIPIKDVDNDVTPIDVFNKIITDCENYNKNVYICSGCGVNINHIAGRYFAGIYCQKCWDNKYKAIEAREGYI